MDLFSIFLIAACMFIVFSIITMIFRRVTMNKKMQVLLNLPECDRQRVSYGHIKIARVYMISIVGNLIIIPVMLVIYYTSIDDEIFLLLAVLFIVLTVIALERVQYYKTIGLQLAKYQRE